MKILNNHIDTYTSVSLLNTKNLQSTNPNLLTQGELIYKQKNFVACNFTPKQTIFLPKNYNFKKTNYFIIKKYYNDELLTVSKLSRKIYKLYFYHIMNFLKKKDQRLIKIVCFRNQTKRIIRYITIPGCKNNFERRKIRQKRMCLLYGFLGMIRSLGFKQLNSTKTRSLKLQKKIISFYTLKHLTLFLKNYNKTGNKKPVIFRKKLIPLKNIGISSFTFSKKKNISN